MPWILAILLASPAAEPTLSKFQATEIHMATSFTIVLYAPDEKTANRAFRAAFARVRSLDQTLSDYDDASELSRLAAQAPTQSPVSVSDDLWLALQRSAQLSQLTDGAFDVTVGPLTRLWRRSRRQKQLPSPERLAEARAAVGYQAIKLHDERQLVELLKPGMRLDMGGIGQGLAADAALDTLRTAGITRAIINASGDIRAGDPPPDSPGWKVGIAPLNPQAPPSQFFLLANAAVSTSGDAFQFVEINGVRYSHIVDPRTGLGLTDRFSVSIFAPDCTTADALATAVCVLGPKSGIELIDKQPRLAAFVVRAGKMDKAETFTSQRWCELTQGATTTPSSPALTPK